MKQHTPPLKPGDRVRVRWAGELIPAVVVDVVGPASSRPKLVLRVESKDVDGYDQEEAFTMHVDPERAQKEPLPA